MEFGLRDLPSHTLSSWVTLQMAVLVLPGQCREPGAVGEQHGASRCLQDVLSLQ